MNESMRRFSCLLKKKRKETSLTQRELARKAGVGIRFIRDVEQGKESVRLDCLNTVLALFGYCAGPVKMEGMNDCSEKG